MNPRLAQKNSRLIRTGCLMVWCASTTCRSSYSFPKVSFCDRCSPPDPPALDNSLIGYPVVDLGGGYFDGNIISVMPQQFAVHFGDVSSNVVYFTSDWLTLVEPDFSRIVVVGANTVAISQIIPKACPCGRANEFDNPANDGDNWRCAECRIIRSMQ